MRLIAGDHDCDSRSQLGNVTVFCEIAQVFRGIVGAVSVVGSAGPVNNHAYDDRLREHDPPQFSTGSTPPGASSGETECPWGRRSVRAPADAHTASEALDVHQITLARRRSCVDGEWCSGSTDHFG